MKHMQGAGRIQEQQQQQHREQAEARHVQYKDEKKKMSGVRKKARDKGSNKRLTG